jgi:tRNA A37 threonylcarbamoyladenosine synthetase subunit TsaC/SUA5/YrdC
MSQYYEIHPDNPQPRLIRHAVDIIRDGGIAVLPTDSSYAIVCHLDDKRAVERIRRIRQLDKKHNFTLVCRDLSEIANYARVDTAEVPRRLQHPKRKTIGIRVPDNAICQELLLQHGQPLMSSTLTMPGREFPETDAEVIRDQLEHQVDLIIDGGHCGIEPTTVVDLTELVPSIIRHGLGSTEGLE